MQITPDNEGTESTLFLVLKYIYHAQTICLVFAFVLQTDSEFEGGGSGIHV